MRGAVVVAALVASAAAGAAGFEDGNAAWAAVCGHCHDTGIGPVLGGRALAPAYVRAVVRGGLGAMPAFRPSEIDDAVLERIAARVQAAPAPETAP